MLKCDAGRRQLKVCDRPSQRSNCRQSHLGIVATFGYCVVEIFINNARQSSRCIDRKAGAVGPDEVVAHHSIECFAQRRAVDYGVAKYIESFWIDCLADMQTE